MEAKTKGFMEDLYFGRIDERSLAADSDEPVDEKKISEFLDRYEAIVKPYNPSDLEAAGTCPPPLMQALKDIGMFGLIIPKEYGGLGYTIPEYLKVVEGMARVDLSIVLIPLAHLSIGLKGILLYGSPEQKQTYLTPAASGKTIFAYALTEPHVGSDAQHVETLATPVDDGWVLNGTKTYITNANYAGAFTVFAQMDPEKPGFMGAFIVERSWDGVEVGADMGKMGLKISSTASIRFKNVKVPQKNLIGSPGDGFKIAMGILNYGRLGLGAASTGVMRQSIRDMFSRSKSRVQFGKPIASYELIQEKMAKAAAHAFACDCITSWTAAMIEKNPIANVAIESSHVKWYGTTRCWDVLYDALQTAGGSGYLSTQPYEKRMRDFRVTTIFEGTSEIHSLYPGLSIFRGVSKAVGDAGKAGGGWARMVAWWDVSRRSGIRKTMQAIWRRMAHMDATYKPEGKRMFGAFSVDQNEAGSTPPILPPALIEAEVRSAYSVMLAFEGSIRAHIRYGVHHWKKDVVEHEFFIRRVTHASAWVFILLAGARRLSRNSGLVSEAELAAYAYLIAEAKADLPALRKPSEGLNVEQHRRIWRSLSV